MYTAPKVPSKAELVSRYSRQMLVPATNGMSGQLAVSSASVLVVGAGGIGVTAILYLAGAGVGRLGIVDFDTVDLSNLHRQVIYRVDEVGKLKVDCAADRVTSLNPSIEVIVHPVRLTYANAKEITQCYDIIVDATDNFTVRYVLNDASVLLSKPLVSGAAVGMEGQATVYLPGSGCLRCVHPRASAAEAKRSCAEVGVLGPVPGLVGCLEAIEVLKLLFVQSQPRDGDGQPLNPHGLMPLNGRQLYIDSTSANVHDFELPPKNPECIICGSASRIRSMEEAAIEMGGCSETCTNQATTTTADPSSAQHVTSRIPLPPEANMTALSYFTDILSKGIFHILVDVRASAQFNMVNLSDAVAAHSTVSYVSVPLAHMMKPSSRQALHADIILALSKLNQLRNSEMTTVGKIDEVIPIFVVCRRGVDSVTATQHLLNLRMMMSDCDDDRCSTATDITLTAPTPQPAKQVVTVVNIEGGLVSWNKFVDPTFPRY